MNLRVEQSLSQLLHEAFVSLRTLGKRSILALLGIVIGSSSVVALINIGHNAAVDAAMIFKDMGTDTLIAQFPPKGTANVPMRTQLDLDAVRRAVPGIAHIGAIIPFSGPMVFHGRTTNANFVGITPDIPPTMRLVLREGRFLSPFDANETYGVIGDQLAQALGAPGDPLKLGDRVRINDYLFQVVGILSNQPRAMLMPVQANETLFMPADGMRRIYANPQISNVIIRAAPGEDMERVARDAAVALRTQLSDHDVEITVPQQMIDGMTRQSRTFAYLLLALGAISLVGGGVGVMNVMLMNVSERRREIGIRMALGARQRDIRNLFLLEAVTLTAVGALCGAVLGMTAAWLYAWLSGWEFALAVAALPLGVGSTLLVGLFFGIYPAVSASRLQPVEALRDE
ncbi:MULTISPECIES: ABC transporter permease [Pseudomonas]|mgnify:CR=1 FL=1|jgi:putative ABC transport system permease protein|uniref:ABC transporter permease n=2 Tax=Pseudomonas TaxID=286 RepID=A0A7M2J041_PSEFL|nr:MULTISPECIES: ABC transporter permease [Pseudomonas]AHC36565.1 ABC transporter permease [Pseudomonas sp. TKP]MBL1308376.1 ABC transporter permease [Pseudomonas sp.]PMX09917.1 ABC transporter permease [Pseudomonas sp. MPBC4-3]PMX48080.1 ABC transporter permease [Pseudomonas sp. FW301-21B01]PMY05492.1 ABC transporter permease [Pseudomonas sp. MPR-R5A]